MKAKFPSMASRSELSDEDQDIDIESDVRITFACLICDILCLFVSASANVAVLCARTTMKVRLLVVGSICRRCVKAFGFSSCRGSVKLIAIY